MKQIIFIFVFFVFASCSKPKTVLICGDHVCVNKAEAQQYFEENLTLEVKVLKNKKSTEQSLIELNLEKSNLGAKQIYIKPKKTTEKNIKKLTQHEKKKIISEIREKKVNKEIASKKALKESNKISRENIKKNMILDKSKSMKRNEVDICEIINECTIDEISKYLINKGKKKSFPDITIRQ